MSQNNFILSLLEIKDPNIRITDVIDLPASNSADQEHTKLIKARLSYPIKRCRHCGFATVVKNGFRKAHVRLQSLNGIRYELELWKQRYYCRQCQTTFGATTNLTANNQTLSGQLKNQIMEFAKEGLNGKLIARVCHCSPSSVRRTIKERIKPHYRMAKLPQNLCFDEFRSVKSIMSFICCDSETHQLVATLHDRLSPSIIDYFENRYSKKERAQVKTVVIDLNAQYQSFIYRLFPNARIIIDRFHIVQLVGRALDNCRVNILKLLDKHTREYKLLKSQWKLFHLKATELQPEKPVYLRGINEYMTKQNAVDLVLNQFPQFSAVYTAYQEITAALYKRDSQRLTTILSQYQNTGTEMDTAIATLNKNQSYVINSTQFEFSNGPLEGINRRIKTLKRSCYGFANQQFLFLRINCLFA
ncbi:ISL3 family transposase [Limosilactobacillus albertensis]|nr:ISL3 family transposase [Limosilactobacillus albertensis]MCD7119051.1 ISL3 family transposase [Limosilactobacillus albertensis]